MPSVIAASVRDLTKTVKREASELHEESPLVYWGVVIFAVFLVLLVIAIIVSVTLLTLSSLGVISLSQITNPEDAIVH